MCSSDLYKEFSSAQAGLVNARNALEFVLAKMPRSEERRVGKSVEVGGRRTMKKKTVNMRAKGGRKSNKTRKESTVCSMEVEQHM